MDLAVIKNIFISRTALSLLNAYLSCTLVDKLLKFLIANKMHRSAIFKSIEYKSGKLNEVKMSITWWLDLYSLSVSDKLCQLRTNRGIY